MKQIKWNRSPGAHIQPARVQEWAEDLVKGLQEMDWEESPIRYISSGNRLVIAQREDGAIYLYETTITGRAILMRDWVALEVVDDDLAETMDQMEAERLVYDERADPRRMWPDWEDA